MQRFTISLDDALAAEFDRLIADRGYVNRSEAVRDLLRQHLDRHREREDPGSHCVACLSYVYNHNHHEHQLAERLTRFNVRAGRRISRWCGAFFSMGHGAVVMAIALAVGLASQRWDAPAWLALSGAVISVLFLLTLGVVNLRAVLDAEPGVALPPQGLKGRYLGRLVHAALPGSVALVGALFALSFDTVSQTALFAAAGVQLAGAGSALLLGLWSSPPACWPPMPPTDCGSHASSPAPTAWQWSPRA